LGPLLITQSFLAAPSSPYGIWALIHKYVKNH